MLRNSFVFLPGISERTEENFWKKGALTWDDLRKRMQFLGVGRTKRPRILDFLDRTEDALRTQNIEFFVRYFPQTEFWRIYEAFQSKTLFLDIETTGLSLYYDKITMIGTYNGREIRVFVKDNNLDEFVDYLRPYDIIVTFNGKLFDVPFIMKEFPEVRIPPVHLDLRYLLRSLGFPGPLKRVEKELGIARPNSIADLNGREAVVLWNQFLRGVQGSLDKFILYNIYDTINLRKLTDICINRKIDEINSLLSNVPAQFDLDGKEMVRPQIAHILSEHIDVPKLQIEESLDERFVVYTNNELMIEIDKNKIRKPQLILEDLVEKIKSKNISPISVGIDLSGSEERRSGFCVLDGEKAYLEPLFKDQEMLDKILELKPALVSIDSPLSLPEGRHCIEDSCECRRFGITREAERTLKKRGINVYPCLIKSMQKLTERGMKISNILRSNGIKVIESYPGAAQDILGLPRKRIDLKELEFDLRNFGIEVKSAYDTITHDEIDALTSALVGHLYLAGEYEEVGNKGEGFLIIPKIQTDRKGGL